MGDNLSEPVFTTLEPEDYYQTQRKRKSLPSAKRRELIAAVESVCERCDEYFPYPQIHHVDGNPLNDMDENLMVVCPNCHVILDMENHYNGRDQWNS